MAVPPHDFPRQDQAAAPTPRALLHRVSLALRTRHYSPRTKKAYIGWIRRFIRFHGRRHPAEMGAQEVTAFLAHLATERKVAASTQNQTLSALLFLYSAVLGQPLASLEQIPRAQRPARVPVVLTRTEVASLLHQLNGPPRLVCEPPRVSRRLHFLGGWGPWEDRGNSHQRSESEPSGWCSITSTSTTRNGPPFGRSPRRSDARLRRCVTGYARPSVIQADGQG